MSVTTIIPVHNGARYIADAIDSVLAQTVAPSEILVIDDGSTDGTAEVVRRYGERVTGIVQKNQGVSAARNHGLQRATGEFVAFLDADDVWHKRKLELQLEALARHPELGLIGAGTFDWPTDKVPELGASPGAVDIVDWDRLILRNLFVTSAVMVRRHVFASAGEFDATLHGPEDHDMWLRITEIAPSANLRLPLTGYRDAAGSLSKRAEPMKKGMKRILEKVGERGGWRSKERLRREALARIYLACSIMHWDSGQEAAAFRDLLASCGVFPMPLSDVTREPRFLRMRRLTNMLLCSSGIKRRTTAPS